MKRVDGYFNLDQEKMFYRANQYPGCFWYLIDGKEFMFKSCEPIYCYVASSASLANSDSSL